MRPIRLSVFHYTAKSLDGRHLALVLVTFLNDHFRNFTNLLHKRMIKRNPFIQTNIKLIIFDLCLFYGITSFIHQN